LKKNTNLLFLALTIVLSFGCNINSNLLLRNITKEDLSNPDEVSNEEYKIAPNDNLQFQISPNKGNRIIESRQGNNQILSATGESSSEINIPVDIRGEAKFPQIGYLKVEGLTVRELEKLLEAKFAEYLVEPYAQIRVTNKKVMVIQGTRANLVTIQNENITLIEALTLAQGIEENGKARLIRVVRTKGKDKKYYNFDFSNKKGFQYATFILQANDVVYVEQRRRVNQKILSELLPYISVITAVGVIISLSRTL
jgi:polysaccharide export outer membrane protein